MVGRRISFESELSQSRSSEPGKTLGLLLGSSEAEESSRLSIAHFQTEPDRCASGNRLPSPVTGFSEACPGRAPGVCPVSEHHVASSSPHS